MTTFGAIISDARKKAGLSQRELAFKIRKENGDAISPQYLNDIEHDRRNPPGEYLTEQFAKALDLPKEALMAAAGVLSADLKKLAVEKIAADKPGHVTEAFKAFRDRIERK